MISQTFGLGQTNWADKFWGIWGTIVQTISTTILALWVPCLWENGFGCFSYKTNLIFRPNTYVSQIYPNSHDTSVVRVLLQSQKCGGLNLNFYLAKNHFKLSVWLLIVRYVLLSTQLHSGLPTPLQKLVSLKMHVTLSNTLLQEKYECKFIEIRNTPLIHLIHLKYSS